MDFKAYYSFVVSDNENSLFQILVDTGYFPYGIVILGLLATCFYVRERKVDSILLQLTIGTTLVFFGGVLAAAWLPYLLITVGWFLIPAALFKFWDFFQFKKDVKAYTTLAALDIAGLSDRHANLRREAIETLSTRSGLMEAYKKSKTFKLDNSTFIKGYIP